MLAAESAHAGGAGILVPHLALDHADGRPTRRFTGFLFAFLYHRLGIVEAGGLRCDYIDRFAR